MQFIILVKTYTQNTYVQESQNPVIFRGTPVVLHNCKCSWHSAFAASILAKAKVDAIAEIETERQGIQNEFINQWIEAAIYDINQQGTDTKEKIDNIKLKILDLIKAFQDAKTEGYAESQAALPTDPEGTFGTAAIITKGEKSITLFNPDDVTYKIINKQ